MKAIFDHLRTMSGGKLTQKQVDAVDQLLNITAASNVANMIGITLNCQMTTSAVGQHLICSFEDLRLQAYDDGVGVWTIGYGTTIYPNKIRVKRGDTCSSEQAKAFFQHDLIRFEAAINESVLVALSQNQFDALVSLAYNIGITAFKNSTLLKQLNNKNYKDAAEQFLVWNKASGKVLRGLVRRREAERNLFIK
ncbi:lysozyme [Acinetobacter higginsii]|uniref:lysozyme n=1 Tax=Acinetobacter higginsii TaxID=70347 RepID=UPI001F4B6462|nr:lysozyme [Acinetobacter higginsii]MCH7305638.1 lysozyme [Acinetobacter higginsii]MCI3877550.1 lysozyme [Acinetobacter higginsii]